MGRPVDGPDEHSAGESPVQNPGGSWPRYLFCVDGDHPERTLPFVCDLVADAGAELIIGSPVVLPDQTPLEAPVPRRDGERLAAKFVFKANQQCNSSSSIDQAVVAGHSRGSILREMVQRKNASTLVTEGQPRSGIRALLGIGDVDDAAATEECDTIVVTRTEHLRTVDSVLVPIAGGPHSELAIETGLALARQNEAPLELLHVYTGDANGRASGDEVLEAGLDRIGGYSPVERTLLEADDVPEAIVERSRQFDVTVLGAPRAGRLRRFVQGTVPGDVDAETDGAVLIARRGGATGSWPDNWI